VSCHSLFILIYSQEDCHFQTLNKIKSYSDVEMNIDFLWSMNAVISTSYEGTCENTNQQK